MQVPNFTEGKVLDTIESLWPGKALTQVLTEIVTLASFDTRQGTGAAILASSGDLRKSWLLRHPVVGLTLVDINVTAECISGARSFCYGTGWSQTKKYAPTRDAAMRSIADVESILDVLAP